MTTRTAVVTGASSGIGEATVRALRGRGWNVIAVARRADRLEALAGETGALFFPADLTAPSDVAALAEFVASNGPLHSIIQVAGGARGADRVDQGDPDDWEWMYQANVLGTQRLVTALLPEIRRSISAAAGHGDVVVVTSTAAQVAYQGGGGYNAAKAAEHMLVAALRLELSGEPIRVIEIAPGMVHTEEFSLRRLGSVEAASAVYEGVDHPLTADDVADVIAYSVAAPAHVNLDLVTMRPVAQSAQHLVHRGPLAVAEDRS